MGLLDSVVGALAGAQGGGSGGGQADLMRVVVGMLANGNSAGGGLGDLVGRFQQGGMGDLVASWIGTGQNLPISPDQLQNVLGSDLVAQIAAQLGLTQGDAAGQLSQMLPQVVDRLTPEGSLPDGGLGDIASVLSRLGGR